MDPLRAPSRLPRPSDACQVELLGTARLLAQRRYVELPAAHATLGSLVLALADACPELVGPVLCPARQSLATGYIFNLNGRDFVADPATPLRPGDRVLLLASAAGG